ncbi:MAG: hypothetical protein AAFY71_11465 [Bacteroidota bacterium]
MSNSPEYLDQQIREAELKKLALEIETLEAERKAQIREEEEAEEEANKPWWKKVNFFRFFGAIAVFFPIAWFYLFEVIGPTIELQNLNRELALTQLNVQIDTLGKKIDEDIIDLEEQNKEQFLQRAGLVEAQQQELNKVDSLLAFTEENLKSVVEDNRLEGDSSTVQKINSLVTAWAQFYTPSRKEVYRIQDQFASFVKEQARKLGGTFTEVEGEVSNVRKFLITDLHNSIFPEDKRNTESVEVESFVQALNNVYTIKSLVNVKYSKLNNASSDKMGEIPKKNARLAIQKLQFQEDFKKNIEKSLRRRISGLELVFE